MPTLILKNISRKSYIYKLYNLFIFRKCSFIKVLVTAIAYMQYFLAFSWGLGQKKYSVVRWCMRVLKGTLEPSEVVQLYFAEIVREILYACEKSTCFTTGLSNGPTITIAHPGEIRRLIKRPFNPWPRQRNCQLFLTKPVCLSISHTQELRKRNILNVMVLLHVSSDLI